MSLSPIFTDLVINCENINAPRNCPKKTKLSALVKGRFVFDFLMFKLVIIFCIILKNIQGCLGHVP